MSTQKEDQIEGQIDMLRQDVEKHRKKAEEKKMPFNEKSYLRRLMQNKNQYYDSAEYVIKHGWPEQTQPVSAYFKQNVPHYDTRN